MNEAEERKLYEDWLHQSPEFADTIISAWDVWQARAALSAQPEPAVPTPDTFMGEPVLTRWKPLNRDDSRLALHQSMHNRSFGNPSDDKLMLEWLWENGYALCKRVPDEAAPTPQQQALDRMVENAETLGLYEAAPTVAEPVAWMWRNTKTGARGVYFEDPEQFCDSSAKGDYEWSPLFTHPPRTALTDEQILAIGRELGVRCKLGGNPNIDFDYARAIEAAHGIGKAVTP